MIEYLGHLNSPTGENVIVCWPDFSVPPGSGTVFPSTTGTTQAQELANPGYFSNIYTVFCPTEILANAFQTVGLTRAVYYPNGTRIYFTDTHYIEISISNSSVRLNYYLPEGTQQIISADPGRNRGIIGPVLNIANYSDTYNTFNCINFLGPNTNTGEYTCGLLSNAIPNNTTLADKITEFFSGVEPFGEPDPYTPGGETEPGGGGGDFDGTSEDIDFPDDPALSAVDTGFLTLFNPSLSQLNDLANFMWGSIFDIENWKKLFANPMDAILGLSMVPVAVPNGGTSSVKVGNIDTGVAMTKAARQYVNVDCGTLNVKEYWGAYLDYSPYTKAEIYLPFIGTHEVSVDDIMGKTVHIKYKVDILSGACVANIKCGGSVLYSYSGQCAATIPITGRDWTQTLSAALSVAGNVLSIAASQGMTAPMAATNIAQSAVNAIKPNIQKTGNIGGMAGIMGIQKPYIILTRPRQAVPKNQNKYTGYPSFITAKLSKCGGYTEVEKIHLDSTSATQDEIKEIETLLDKGVIF